MTKEKADPQSPEEMARAAQEAAVKAAMEQAQAMFGNIPGAPECLTWRQRRHSMKPC